MMTIKRRTFIQTSGPAFAALTLAPAAAGGAGAAGAPPPAAVAQATTFGRDPLYDQLWRDPAIVERIGQDTRRHRMSFATLRFVDRQGKPLPNVEVEVAQVSHDFLFGANVFMLGGFDTPDRNRRFEQTFVSLFNFATVPFYWSDLEPEQGKPRFAKDSAPIYRRPPPDAVLEFCEAHGITPKGHPLIWQQYVPAWLPKDAAELLPLMRRRFEEIAARYGNRIKTWEVVNEAVARYRHPEVVLPKDYVYTSLREAERIFPASSKLMVNETTRAFGEFSFEDSAYFLLLQNQLLRGSRIDAVGLQFHLFSEQQYAEMLAGKVMAPDYLFRVLDQYAELRRPIQITEITIPTLPNTGPGERDQAEAVKNLYRLWFSHPSVEAITWWNVVDGTAVKGEDKWRGGLFREDFSPKPSHAVLDELINKEWRTNLTLRADGAAAAKFQGFRGRYRITARRDGRSVAKEIHLSGTGTNDFTIEF